MTQTDYIMTIGFTAPMTIGLVCAVLLIMFRYRNHDATQRRLTGIMIPAYLLSVLSWLCMVLYIVDYNAFVWAHSPFLLIPPLGQVLHYRFFFEITGTGHGERFPRIHYIIPVVLAATLGVWSLLTPYDVQYSLVATRGEPVPGYELFSRFFASASSIMVSYYIVYPLLGLFRIIKFRRAVVNYSADEQRTSVRWMYIQFVLIMLIVPVISLQLFIHKSVFYGSVLTACAALLPLGQYLFICYHLMSGDYVIIQPPEPEEEKPQRIDRRRFEDYMQRDKPYLDPKLRITNLCLALGTNRSYLSAFINNEYGMNFSRYINRLRLEELDRIRLAAKSGELSGMDMVLEAGFSSYRSYLRVKQGEDNRKVVEIFD